MRRAVLPLLFAVAVAACHGSSTDSTPAPPASASAPAPGETAPPPSATAALAPPPLASASAADTSAVGAAAGATGAVGAAAGATAHAGAPTTTAAAPSAPLVPGTGSHFEGKHFTLDVPAPAGCAKGQPCSFVAKLTATGAFHVNKEYPYKLTMTAVPGVEFLGNDVAARTVFSKHGGDFTVSGEKSGTMVVRYQPKVSGPVNFTGTLKLSVCNASTCLMDQAPVKASVPVR